MVFYALLLSTSTFHHFVSHFETYDFFIKIYLIQALLYPCFYPMIHLSYSQSSSQTSLPAEGAQNFIQIQQSPGQGVGNDIKKLVLTDPPLRLLGIKTKSCFCTSYVTGKLIWVNLLWFWRQWQPLKYLIANAHLHGQEYVKSPPPPTLLKIQLQN